MRFSSVELYEKMHLIQRFEEELLDLFKEKKVCGFLHPSLGHEALEVGVVSALSAQDQVVTYYRGHGHCLARGSDPKRIMAEIMGRKEGYCGGKGGSLHLIDPEHNICYATGIVGGGIPVACGYALANKLSYCDRAVVCFFGDGATNNGVFFESLNFAAYLELPIVFVCENNGIAQSVKTCETSKISDIFRKGQALGVKSLQFDGTDVDVVYETAHDILAEVKNEQKPCFVEYTVKRLTGHTAFDGDGSRYLSQQDIEDLKRYCPVKRQRAKLIASGLIDHNGLRVIEEQNNSIVLEAVAWADMAEHPTLEEAFQGLLSQNIIVGV